MSKKTPIDLRLAIISNKDNLNVFFKSITKDDLFPGNEDVVMSILTGDFSNNDLDINEFLNHFKEDIPEALLKDAIVLNINKNMTASDKIKNISSIIIESGKDTFFEDFLFYSNSPVLNKIIKEELLKKFSEKIIKTEFNPSVLAELSQKLGIDKQYSVSVFSKLSFIKLRTYITFYDDFILSIKEREDFKSFKLNNQLIKKLTTTANLTIDYLKEADVLNMLLSSEPKKSVKEVLESFLLNKKDVDNSLMIEFIDGLRNYKQVNMEMVNLGLDIAKDNLKKIPLKANEKEDVCFKILNASNFLEVNDFIRIANIAYNSFIEKYNMSLLKKQNVNEYYRDDVFISNTLREKSNMFCLSIISRLINYDLRDDKSKKYVVQELSKERYKELVNVTDGHGNELSISASNYNSLFILLRELKDEVIIKSFKDEVLNQFKDTKQISTKNAILLCKIIEEYYAVTNDNSFFNNERIKNLKVDSYQVSKKIELDNCPFLFALLDYYPDSVLKNVEINTWKDIVLTNKKINIIKDIFIENKHYDNLNDFLKNVITADKELKNVMLNKRNINAIIKTKDIPTNETLSKIILMDRINNALSNDPPKLEKTQPKGVKI